MKIPDRVKRFMPRQKPGRSETVVATPWNFVKRAAKFIDVPGFAWDLAADEDNNKGLQFINSEQDSLLNTWSDLLFPGQWAWLNPPYNHIRPWVRKAEEERTLLPNYCGIAVLVPASTGSNWWRDHVHDVADVVLLNGRITFVGHASPYPKDLALLLYYNGFKPAGPGYRLWSWEDTCHDFQRTSSRRRR